MLSKFIIPILFFLFLNKTVELESISEHKLVTNCSSSSGIQCKCSLNLIKVDDLQDIVITLSSCYNHAVWSSWSSWSNCISGKQRRTRTCSNNFGSRVSLCNGKSYKVRYCHRPPANIIPDFVWGLWSDWNEWTNCDCEIRSRRRTRHCLSKSCEGCHVETQPCHVGCATVKQWSEWTEWAQNNETTELRLRVAVTVDSVRNITFEWRTEARHRPLKTNQHEWSNWQIQRTVAFRHRNLPNGTIQVDHRLIATVTRHNVSLEICVASSVLFLLIGFTANFIIKQAFS